MTQNCRVNIMKQQIQILTCTRTGVSVGKAGVGSGWGLINNSTGPTPSSSTGGLCWVHRPMSAFLKDTGCAKSMGLMGNNNKKKTSLFSIFLVHCFHIINQFSLSLFIGHFLVFSVTWRFSFLLILMVLDNDARVIH